MSDTVTVTVTPGYQPPPPTPRPDTVTISMPRHYADALRTFFQHYVPARAFNELVEPGEHAGKPFHWDHTPGNVLDTALKVAGVKGQYHRTLDGSVAKTGADLMAMMVSGQLSRG